MKSNNGFTLVELLVVIAVAGILLVVVFYFLIWGCDSFMLGSNRAERQDAIRLLESVITNELRNTTGISISSKTTKDYSEATGSIGTLSLTNNLFYHDGKKVTNYNFSDLSFEIIGDASLNKYRFIKFTISFIDGEREDYEIKISLNNCHFESTTSSEISLSSNILKYKK